MSQTTQHILMIRPKHFSFNAETAANNSFQQQDKQIDAQTVSSIAIVEFDAFVQKLRSQGIDVIVVEDTDTPIKPDAVFPTIDFISRRWFGVDLSHVFNQSAHRKKTGYHRTTETRFWSTKTIPLSNYEEDGIF